MTAATTQRPVILFVDQYAHIGGAQRVLLDLLPALDEYTCIFALPGPGGFTTELERRGTAWHMLPVADYTTGHKTLSDAFRYLSDAPATARRMARLARKVDAALIYVNGPRLFAPGALAALSTRIPSLWHFHWQAASRVEAGLVSLAASIARPAVVACSNACLEPFHPRGAVRRDAAVVYNGVRAAAGSRREPGARTLAAPVIGAIGRLHPDKGQEDLLRAAEIVVRTLPRARFVFAGPEQDPVYVALLRFEAGKLPAGAVSFLGELSWPAPASEAIDILAVPSRRDPAPLVVPEAFAAGIPVIASAAGGNREMVAHGRNGLLFPAGDYRELADSILEVALNPALRARLVRGGFESYEQRWRLERFQREMREQIARQTTRRMRPQPVPA